MLELAISKGRQTLTWITDYLFQTYQESLYSSVLPTLNQICLPSVINETDKIHFLQLLIEKKCIADDAPLTLVMFAIKHDMKTYLAQFQSQEIQAVPIESQLNIKILIWLFEQRADVIGTYLRSIDYNARYISESNLLWISNLDDKDFILLFEQSPDSIKRSLINKINDTNERGENFLFLRPSVNKLKCLLKFGANLKATTEEGKTPLVYYTESKLHGCVKFLLAEKKNELDSQDIRNAFVQCNESKTLSEFFQVCKDRHLAVAGKTFLIQDKNKNTILHVMATKLQSKTIKHLFNFKTYYFNHCLRTYIDEKNEDGDTALHIALQHNDTSVIKLLLENKASIYEQNKAGDTALHIALQNNNTSVINQLLENKAPICRPLNVLGQCPIDLICNRPVFDKILQYAVSTNDIEAITLLITFGIEKLNFARNDIVTSAIRKADKQPALIKLLEAFKT